MSNTEDWLVAKLLSGVAITALYLWLRSTGQKSADYNDGRFTLRFGIPARLFAVFLCGVAIVLSYFASGSAPEDRVLITSVLIFITFTAIYLLLDAFGTSVLYNEREIISRVPWRPNRTILWQDVERIDYEERSKYWVLRTRSGQKVRLSAFMQGIDEFVVMVDEFIKERPRAGLSSSTLQ